MSAATKRRNREILFFIVPSRLAQKPLRSRQNDGEVEGEDDNELDRRSEQVPAHDFNEADDHARNEGPDYAAEAAERHHDEGYKAEIAAYFRKV